jgi:hypothetical protein
VLRRTAESTHLENTIKAKAGPLHAMEAQGERMYSSYSFTTSALDGGEWSASRLGRALPPGKDPRYPLYRRLGGPQSQSGHTDWRRNFLPLPGIERRSPGRPVHSQTQYRLSYPGSFLKIRALRIGLHLSVWRDGDLGNFVTNS